jgi:hypothetical protein
MIFLAVVFGVLVTNGGRPVIGPDPAVLCHYEGSTYSLGSMIEMIEGQLRVCQLDDGTPVWSAVEDAGR